MALFYLVLALAIPLLLRGPPAAVWGFAVLFGFAMGADYMLIPLVTADCFGLVGAGKLLSLTSWDNSSVNGFALGGGRIFDAAQLRSLLDHYGCARLWALD